MIRDKDNGFRALLERMRKATHPNELTVGIHEAEGSAPKEEEDGGSSELTLAEIAAIHEFGYEEGGIPRRSFINDWADENEAKHKAQLETMAKAIVAGKVASVEQGLARLGSLYAGEVQKRIADGIEPPLSESTVKRKGSSTPLIDTGQLRASVHPYVNGKRTG